MISDSYFTIGNSHIVCQDYAFSGINSNGNSVAIVSDGCSSSQDTDFGSRYLVRSSFIIGSNIIEIDDLDLFSNLLIKNSVFYSSQFLNGLLLSKYSLDATLLYAEERNDFINVVVAGDGIIFAKTFDDNLEIWNIEFPSGSPFYPSYFLDKERYNKYISDIGINRIENYYFDGKLISSNISNDLFFTKRFFKNNYKFIGLSSDGILTCNNLSIVDVINDVTNYKNYVGDFVKRRVKKFIKQCNKNNNLPYDDISFSVLYLENNN